MLERYPHSIRRGCYDDVNEHLLTSVASLICLTHVRCRGYRSDYTLIKSLIFEFCHAVETRRGDGDVASVDLLII